MSALRRVAGRVASAPSLAQHESRRHASAKWAPLKVKKNNWVEQNEIRRENSFYQWAINKKNYLGLLVMTVGFPLFYHNLTKEELKRRDAIERGVVGGRDYL